MTIVFLGEVEVDAGDVEYDEFNNILPAKGVKRYKKDSFKSTIQNFQA
jgi:hypothetical protein